MIKSGNSIQLTDQEETKAEQQIEEFNGQATSPMVARWYRPPEIILGENIYD